MIDWTKHIEAYHPDGRVREVEVISGPDEDGDYTTKWGPSMEVWLPDGRSWCGDDWRIRNCTPKQPLVADMALLDYFAGQALTSLLGNQRVKQDLTFEQICAGSYDLAQAMMAERQKHLG